MNTVSAETFNGSLYDYDPAFSVQVGIHDVPAWVIVSEHTQTRDITRGIMCEQGWTAGVDSLAWMGSELARQLTDTAVIIHGYPHLKIHTVKDILHNLDTLQHNGIGRQRTDTVLSVGEQACKLLGLSEAEVIGHSLGALTSMQAASEANDGFRFIRATGVASAGRVPQGQVPRTLVRAPRAFCGKDKKLLTNILGLVNNLKYQNIIQVSCEAGFALTEPLRDHINTLHTVNPEAEIAGMDCVNDILFPPSIMPSDMFGDNFIVMHEGCACHGALSHPSEAPRYARALVNLWRRQRPAVIAA